MATLAELEREVLRLPEDQRVALVHRVLKGTEPDESAEVNALWDDEIARRIKMLDQGLTERIPATEVFQELDQKLA